MAIEARKAATHARDSTDTADSAFEHPDAEQAGGPDRDEEPSAAGGGAPVITLASRRPLPADNRPVPSVAIYDQLLTRQPKGTA